jgi:hypothetical protein
MIRRTHLRRRIDAANRRIDRLLYDPGKRMEAAFLSNLRVLMTYYTCALTRSFSINHLASCPICGY